MAVVYIVAKGGGQWRLYAKDTGTGYKRYTPGSKREAIKQAKQRAKDSAEASVGPDSALFIKLSASREVQEARVYGEETTVKANIRRDKMQTGPYGVPVEVTFRHGSSTGSPTMSFILADYMTKTEAQQNARELRQ